MSVRWAKLLTRLTDLESAARDGFQTVQLNANDFVDLDENGFDKLRSTFGSTGLSAEVCSVPLPPEVRVTEKGFNIYAWTEHVKKGIRMASALGCRELVWSEGRARVLPWEGDISGLKEQLLQFLWILCDICGQYGIRLLIEPLGPRRTNFLNSMEETSDFIRMVNKDNLAALISLRELAEIKLDDAGIQRFSHLIAHVHLEDPQLTEGPRVGPLPEDGYDYRPFLRALRGVNYAGIITLPSDSTAASLAYCQKLWNEL